MKELLKTVIKDWQNTFPRLDVRERALQVPADSQKIISLIGPRRSGKTYCLYQLINSLLPAVGRDHILYINFEDERLELESSQLRLILEAFYELYPKSEGSKLFLFFDEIQEIA